jgi:hypothetical protein
MRDFQQTREKKPVKMVNFRVNYWNEMLMTYRNFKSEIFLQILDNHDQKWKFDSQVFLWFYGTRYECCATSNKITKNDL